MAFRSVNGLVLLLLALNSAKIRLGQFVCDIAVTDFSHLHASMELVQTCCLPCICFLLYVEQLYFQKMAVVLLSHSL